MAKRASELECEGSSRSDHGRSALVFLNHYVQRSFKLV